MIIHEGHFKAVRTYIDDPASAENRQGVLSLDEPLLVGRESGERLSFRTLWQKLINSHSVWKNIPEGGPPIEVTVKVADHISEGYTAEIEGRVLPVCSIEFDATLHAYFPIMPLNAACRGRRVFHSSGPRRQADLRSRWEVGGTRGQSLSRSDIYRFPEKARRPRGCHLTKHCT
jgi:hypothetical protein